MIKIQNHINGKYREPLKQKYLDNYNPSKGEVYSLIADSDEEDVAMAVEFAKSALPEWKVLPDEKRFKILNRVAELIDENQNKLAEAESTDQGKPLYVARAEINRAAQNFRFFATAAMQFASESHNMAGYAVNYTLKTPIGVVGCISPWNLPLYLFTWKIAPALATGNCVVAKPSEITPMTAYLLGELCNEAGMPPGVLNIVHGLGPKVGSALVSHPGIKAISFTGGTATGKNIAATAAPMFKKLSLELGGKNPNIIFADCDLDKAVHTTVRSSFQNQGEICLCGSRIFVERSLYEDFKQKFVEQIKKLKVGPALDPDTKVGAIVSKMHFEKILSYIELAKEEGGNLIAGGNIVKPDGHENGWYIEPTLIENLPYTCRTNQEEIFGPVVSITPFDTVEEVLKMANSTEYGLACSIWTENLSKAHRVAAEIESGIVWINCWLLRDLRTPFGGVKQSGVGREGGWYAMNFFTEAKNVCVKL
ncbi:MAG: aldehyde dehydrogenase [Flavobacteriales bacterium]|nr:aldehyde dehydrogenase [Flavobacteriales bacterium]